MDHFYLGIQGWLKSPTLFRMAVAQAPEGAQFVEVGCWKGQSTAFLGVEIINSAKNITLHAVDHWQGDRRAAGRPDLDRLFETFCENMHPIRSVLQIHRLPSVAAAATFADESLDFVYIDAEPDYEDVRADIAAWLPKVKNGGLIAGDDVTVRPSHPDGDRRRPVAELLPHYHVIVESPYGTPEHPLTLHATNGTYPRQTWVHRKGAAIRF